MKGYDFATQAFLTADLYRAENIPAPALCRIALQNDNEHLSINAAQPKQSWEELKNATARHQGNKETHRHLLT